MGSAKKTKAVRGKKKGASAKAGRLAGAVRSPWFLAVGGVIALLSLVAAVFGPVPDLFKDETSVANFRAEPENKPGVTEFALPLDARLEEMPSGGGFYCSPDIVEWLEEVGTEIPPYQRIAIQNTAEEGAMLAMSNVRAVDVRKYEPRPVMVFECPDGGSSDSALLHLRLDRDPQAQEVDRQSNETRPFAFNLEPGERGGIVVVLLGDRGHSYSGRLVADISSGGRTKTVDLPLNGRVDGFDRISPGKYGKVVVKPGPEPGTFHCVEYSSADPENRDPKSDLTECTPDQARAKFAGIG